MRLLVSTAAIKAGCQNKMNVLKWLLLVFGNNTGAEVQSFEIESIRTHVIFRFILSAQLDWFPVVFLESGTVQTPFLHFHPVVLVFVPLLK